MAQTCRMSTSRKSLRQPGVVERHSKASRSADCSRNLSEASELKLLELVDNLDKQFLQAKDHITSLRSEKSRLECDLSKVQGMRSGDCRGEKRWSSRVDGPSCFGDCSVPISVLSCPTSCTGGVGTVACVPNTSSELLRADIQRISNERDSVRAQLTQATMSYMDDLRRMEDKVTESERRCRSYELQCRELSSNEKHLRDTLSKAECQIQHQADSICRYEASLAAANEEQHNLKRTMDKMQQEIVAANNRSHCAEKRVAGYEQRVCELHSKLQCVEKSIDQLKHEMAARDSNIATLEAEKMQLHNEIHELNNTCNQLRALLHQKDEEMSVLVMRLSQSESEVNRLKEELSVSQREREHARRELDKAQHDIRDMMEDMDQLHLNNKRLADQLSQSQLAHQRACQNLDRCEKTNRTLETNIVTLSREKDDLEESLMNERSRVSQLEGDLSCAHQELSKATSALHELECSLKESDEGNKKLCGINKQMAENAKRLEATLAEIRTSESKLHQTNHQLENECRDLRERLVVTETRTKSLENENQSLRVTLGQEMEERQRLKRERDSLKYKSSKG